MATTAISKAHIGRMAHRAEALQKRLSRFKEKAQETTEKVVRTVEVGSMALGMGILQGRSGSIEVMGVPLELGAGVALNLLGYFGAAGKHSDHLNNFGDGALASYLTTVGKGVGAAMKAKSLGAGAAPAQVTKGSGDLTPAEIAAADSREETIKENLYGLRHCW
jgi:hypothetical protein